MEDRLNTLVVIAILVILSVAVPRALASPDIPLVGELVSEEIAFMSQAHHNGGVVSYDGKLYVWGGRPASGGTIASLEIYDPANNIWSAGPSAPVDTQGMGDFGITGGVYTIGGEKGAGSFRSDTHMYDIASNIWETKSSLPTNIWDPMSVACGGIGYIISGRHGYGPAYAHVFAYEPQDNSWSRKADMPYHMFHGGAVCHDEKIWIFGGNHQTGENTHEWLRKVEIYDPSTNTWAYGDDMPTPQLYYTQGVIFDGDIWLFSNLAYDDNSHTWIHNEFAYRFSPDDGRWTKYQFRPPDGIEFLYLSRVALIGSHVYFTNTYEIGSGTASERAFRVDLSYQANMPPVANAGPDQTVEQESYDGTEVTLNGSGSTDPDSTPGTNDDIVYFDWWEGDIPLWSGETIDYVFPLGSHTVILKVTDSFGQTDEDKVIITVVDTTPPAIELFEPEPSELWPPNHKFVEVVIFGTAGDICDAGLDIDVSVEVLDAEGGDGGPNHEPDYEVICAGIVDGDVWIIVSLRAERSGKGDGRVYRITATVTDDSGNSTTSDPVEVTVPDDQGNGKGKGKK